MSVLFKTDASFEEDLRNIYTLRVSGHTVAFHRAAHSRFGNLLQGSLAKSETGAPTEALGVASRATEDAGRDHAGQQTQLAAPASSRCPRLPRGSDISFKKSGPTQEPLEGPLAAQIQREEYRIWLEHRKFDPSLPVKLRCSAAQRVDCPCRNVAPTRAAR